MTPSRSNTRGIGYYLIALIMLAAVPLVVIAGILVWRQGELQRHAFERSLLQTAGALSLAVDRQLDTYQVMLETLAQSEVFARGDIAGFHAVASRVANVHGALFISLFDRDGRQLFNTLFEPGKALPTPFKDPRVGKDDPDSPPFGDPSALKRTLETGQVTNSDLLVSLVAGRLIFTMNIPVMVDGKVAYVLNAAFTPDAMTRLLQENAEFRNVPAMIFDRRGFIVGRWEKAEDFVGRRVFSSQLHLDGSRESFVGEGKTLEGLSVYFSYARSRRSGWGVNVGAASAQLERELRTVHIIGIGLAAAGMVLGLLLALGLASRLRQSIAGLAESASRSMPPRVRGLRTREIVQLEQALVESAAAREAQAVERESRLVAETRKAEAEEATRMKDKFIAVLSHELRNPLAPVRNGVHLLRRLQEKGDTAAMNDVIDMLDRQSDQLARLVNELLDVARVTTGRIELERRRLDLRDVTRTAVETAAPALAARGHDLQLDIAAQPLEVTGDFMRLAQVASNLLDNAVKFTPAGGRIRVALRAESASAVLSVADSGRGIAALRLPGIFEAGATTATASEGGLGLGLALARTLVELHGGTLDARSEGEGKGSEFRVRLPLA
jgi:signal transduction histidine kinase